MPRPVDTTAPPASSASPSGPPVRSTEEPSSLLRALSDPIRLRILALVELAELTVGELSRSLGLAQSRVSNHLRVLRELDLLVERHVGTSTFLRSAIVGARGGEDPADLPARLWATLRPTLAALPAHAGDLARLRRVLAERRGAPEFFDRVAHEWDKIGGDFTSGQARQRVLANLLPPGLVVADLGCGTGYFARALLGLCSRLVCVDASEGMLAVARERLAPIPPQTTVEFRVGGLDALPLEAGELDALVCGMVLHHLPEMERAAREMHRVLRPGGTAAILELEPHKEAWMRTALGDRHLGLEAQDVVRAFERAGFVDLRFEDVDDRYAPEPEDGPAPALGLYIVRARKAD